MIIWQNMASCLVVKSIHFGLLDYSIFCLMGGGMVWVVESHLLQSRLTMLNQRSQLQSILNQFEVGPLRLGDDSWVDAYLSFGPVFDLWKHSLASYKYVVVRQTSSTGMSLQQRHLKRVCIKWCAVALHTGCNKNNNPFRPATFEARYCNIISYKFHSS